MKPTKPRKRSSLSFVTITDYVSELLPPVRVERSATQCIHTPQPSSYLAWHEWAGKASKTHRQVKCPRCGKWAIWLPKAEARKVNAADRAADRRIVKLTGKIKVEG